MNVWASNDCINQSVVIKTRVIRDRRPSDAAADHFADEEMMKTEQ